MQSGEVFAELMHVAVKNGLTVRFAPLKANYARLNGAKLALDQNMGIDEINHNLAHELAHSYLHYDKGDTIASEQYEEYEEQAERAAKMILDILENTFPG